MKALDHNYARIFFILDKVIPWFVVFRYWYRAEGITCIPLYTLRFQFIISHGKF